MSNWRYAWVAMSPWLLSGCLMAFGIVAHCCGAAVCGACVCGYRLRSN